MQKGSRSVHCALAAIVGVCLVCGAHEDADCVLYWMVTDPLAGGLSVPSLEYVRDMTGDEKYAAARVAVYKSDGSRASTSDGSDAYLDVWGLESERSDVFLMPDSKGHWQTEAPTYADLAGYCEDSSYRFLIEIGVYSENDAWIVLAVSQTATYEQLYKGGFVTKGNMTQPEHIAWTGGSYAVPEPSSGLLLLVGAGLLSLRRRRRAV